jgi:hypothetical protein
MAQEKSWSETFQDVVGGLVGAYGQVETVKAQAALEKAKASWAAYGLPYAYMNPQASAGAPYLPAYQQPQIAPLLVIGAVVLGVVLLARS